MTFQELADAKAALATELQRTSKDSDDAEAALRTAERRMRVTRQGLREQQEMMEVREANLIIGSDFFFGGGIIKHPENERLEPEDTFPWEKEKHRQQTTIFGGFHVSFFGW